NPLDSSFWLDPYRYYPSLLSEPPRLLPTIVPLALISRYRDVVAVLRDPARFSSQLPPFEFIEKIDPFGVPTILHSDPPEHTRTRKLVANYFKPACLDRIASLSRSICRTLLDKIEIKGEFDAVADLACPLPLAIVAKVLGVPTEDQATL